MSRKWMMLSGLGLVVALLVLSLALPAAAQDMATPTEPTTKARGSSSKGLGLWFDRGSWATFDAVAEVLGLTPVELFSELHSGKSVEEVATAKGIDLQKVQDAAEAARLAARKAEIEQALEEGAITQEQADWMLRGLEQGWMPMVRSGRGHGMGGRGAPSGGSAPSESTMPGSTTPPAPGASSL